MRNVWNGLSVLLILGISYWVMTTVFSAVNLSSTVFASVNSPNTAMASSIMNLFPIMAAIIFLVTLFSVFFVTTGFRRRTYEPSIENQDHEIDEDIIEEVELSELNQELEEFLNDAEMNEATEKRVREIIAAKKVVSGVSLKTKIDTVESFEQKTNPLKEFEVNQPLKLVCENCGKEEYYSIQKKDLVERIVQCKFCGSKRLEEKK